MQVAVVLLFFLLVVRNHAKMICSSNTNLEPKLYDILLPFVSSLLSDKSPIDVVILDENMHDSEVEIENSLLSDASVDVTVEPIHSEKSTDIDTDSDNVKQFNKYVEQAAIHISRALNHEVPFVSFISDGRFDIDLTNSGDLWNRIILLEKKHFLVSSICSNDLLQPYVQSWCQCENDYSFNTKDGSDDYYMFKNATEYIQQYNPGKWCKRVEKECTSNDYHNKKCAITKLNPFRSTCLWIPTEDAEALVSYTLETPMVSSHYNITSMLVSIADLVGRVFEGDSSLPEAIVHTVPVLSNYAETVGSSLDSWAAYVPYYLANFITGFIILYLSESLTSSSLFRYSIAAFFGLLIAFMMFAIYMYRTVEGIVRQSVPSFLHFLFVPLTAVFTSYIYSYAYLQHFLFTVFEMSIGFWKHGAFGFDWLGKAFFLSSAILSMILTKYFKFFKEKTLSHNALYYMVIGLGSYFVLQGSSSIEVAFSLLLLILYWDELSQQLYVWYVQISGAQEKTHIKKISVEVPFFILLSHIPQSMTHFPTSLGI